MKSPKNLLHIDEAAERLNCSPSTVRRLIAERKLEACKIREQGLRIVSDSLENYISQAIMNYQLDHGKADF